MSIKNKLLLTLGMGVRGYLVTHRLERQYSGPVNTVLQTTADFNLEV